VTHSFLPSLPNSALGSEASDRRLSFEGAADLPPSVRRFGHRRSALPNFFFSLFFTSPQSFSALSPPSPSPTVSGKLSKVVNSILPCHMYSVGFPHLPPPPFLACLRPNASPLWAPGCGRSQGWLQAVSVRQLSPPRFGPSFRLFFPPFLSLQREVSRLYARDGSPTCSLTYPVRGEFSPPTAPSAVSLIRNTFGLFLFFGI